MYFKAKVEDGCIKIPEELMMFFEPGDEVAVTTGMDDERERERRIIEMYERRKNFTIEDMRNFFNAVELDPEDAKYNREELHRRGSSIS